MELFAGRDNRFLENPRSDARAEDPSAMLVIRDALLLQLQQDRLRQEIILAELAKIERATALRAADAERASPVAPFSFLEETPHRHSIVAADVDNALKKKKKKKDGVRGGVQPECKKPAATEDLVRECLKTSYKHYEGEQPHHGFAEKNLSLNLDKLAEKTETPEQLELRRKEVRIKDKAVTAAAPPIKPEGALATEFARREPDIMRLYATQTRLPPLGWELPEITITVDRPRSCGRWSCAVCQVDSASEHELHLHRAGKKHCAKAAAVEARIKAIGALKAAKPKKRRLQYKPADLENKANIKEKATPEGTSAGAKRKLTATSLPVKKQKSLGQWSCVVCQVPGTNQHRLEEHLAGKPHRSKVAALQTSRSESNGPNPNTKATTTKATPARSRIVATNAQQGGKEEAPENKWTCTLCQAKGTSESDYYSHLETSRHWKKAKARRAELSRFYCAVCDLQCCNEIMLASHLGGRRHRETLVGRD